MEKKGLSDCLALAHLFIKNALMELSAPVLLLGVLVGLVLIALSFFFYGLVTLLQEVLPQPGLAHLAVGGGVLLVLFAVWSGLAWQRRREMLQLKKHLPIYLAAWVQKYPWGATGIAVGVGFVASSQTYLTDILMPLGKAIVPVVLDLYAQQISQTDGGESCKV